MPLEFNTSSDVPSYSDLVFFDKMTEGQIMSDKLSECMSEKVSELMICQIRCLQMRIRKTSGRYAR